MATIQIPDEYVEGWSRFDEVLNLLRNRVVIDPDDPKLGEGLSRHDISQAFKLVTSVPPWSNLSFRLWASVRHMAVDYGDFQMLLMGWKMGPNGLEIGNDASGAETDTT
jgi:hypothetical protein